MKIKIKISELILLLFWAVSLLIGVFYKNAYLFSVLLCCAWGLGLIFAIKKLKSRFTLFSFNVGFFVFLIGGYLIEWLMNGEIGYFNNTRDAVDHTCFCLYLTCSSINLFYSIWHRQGETEKTIYPRAIVNVKTVRSVLLTVLVISFVCELILEITTTVYLRTTTYANSLSVSLNIGLPGIITYPASLYYVALFGYWATNPPKKQTIISMISLFIIEIIILISGERGEPISLIFTMVFYIMLRNRQKIHDIVIPKKAIFIVALCVPILIFGLQVLSYSRVNKEYTASVGESIEEFFGVQGGSSKIIANAYELKDEITDVGGNTFIFGTVRNYFKNNVFTRLLFGISRSQRSVATAYEGDSFLATYGYVYSPVTYAKGVGSGSTFIAEAYQDGGYICLLLLCLFYGWLISRIDAIGTRSVISTIIKLNFFRYMILLPRGIALQWLVSTFAIQNLMFFLLLYFVCKYEVEQSTYVTVTGNS